MKFYKNIFLLIICNLIDHDIYSQYSFDLLISSPLYEKIFCSDEDSAGNFYFAGFKAELYSPQDCAWFLKIDFEGKIIQENLICVPDTILHPNLIQLINDSIFIFGCKGSVSSGYKDLLWLLKLDTNLQIIENKSRRTIPDFHYRGPEALVTRNNHTILLGNSVTDTNSQVPDICFYELDENYDSVRFYIDYREGAQVGVDFLFDPIALNYKVFGHGNYPNTYTGYDELIRFDSNFNLLSVDSIAWKVFLQLSAKVFDDSSCLVTGNKWIGGSPINKNVGIVKLDYNDNLLETNHFGKSSDTADYPGIKYNVDFIDKNNIYCGGTSNFFPDQWPWQTDNSWIILVNLDSNLNVNWQRFYGGDAFYHLWGLLATQDGGCLMYAVRYDENTQFEEYDVYILKVDSNGLLTSAREYPSISINELIIFPNPARDRITVRYPDIFDHQEREIIIYNSSGSEVRRANRPPGRPESPVDISGLASGLYIAVLKAEGEKIAAGKFVVR